MAKKELGNLLPFEVPFATILTQVEVDCGDPAFKKPTNRSWLPPGAAQC